MKKQKKDMSFFQTARDNMTLLSATIELLTECNWHCKHCYIPLHNHCGLPKEVVIDIFRQLRELYTFELTLTGGEIFLRTDIMDILTTARDMGFTLKLFTNLSLLTEDKIKILSEIYIEEISCTIFSLNDEVHDAITGVKGSLLNSMQNMKLIRKYGLPLTVKTILMKENAYEYRELKRYCDSNGFGYLATNSIFPKNDGDTRSLNYAIDFEHLFDILPEIDKYRDFKEHEIYPHEHICENCSNSYISIAIDTNGVVYPCNNMPISAGNILGKDSFECDNAKVRYMLSKQ